MDYNNEVVKELKQYTDRQTHRLTEFI